MDRTGYDFLIIGAGAFGLSTALALRKHGGNVAILDAGKIPHPKASSTDISKAVRVEYGLDLEYMMMANLAIDGWQAWNEQFGLDLYHQVGFLLLTPSHLESSGFEWNCWTSLVEAGFDPVRMDLGRLAESYPEFNHQWFSDGLYHARGGFALASATIKNLHNHARTIGIKVLEDRQVEQFITKADRVEGVITVQGEQFFADQVVVCAGNFTPYLIPELAPYFNITAHPVFHIKPSQPERFESHRFPVFAADISNTGWYGFPLHPETKVVKIAKHGPGTIVNPEHDSREVSSVEENDLREFLRMAIPALASEPVVYSRRCCYTDTLDGHFWIDRHPDWRGLTVGTGGSGHGFKMAPVIGDIIADVTLGKQHRWSNRYKWRQLSTQNQTKEEARYYPSKETNSDD